MFEEYRAYAEERLKSLKMRLQIMENSQQRHIKLRGSESPEIGRQIELLRENIQKWENNVYVFTKYANGPVDD